MIAGSLEEHEDLAVGLARHPLALAHLKDKLEAARSQSPLFDTARLVKNLEKAFKEMWQIRRAGERPRMIKVTENYPR